MNRSTPAQFWAKTLKRENGCWEWSGAHFHNGYGRARYHGRDTVAHVIAWELTNGPVPQGLELDHECRNRGCINPAHLEPVTHQVNQMRGTSFVRENAEKTECLKGHPLSGENLFIRNDGRRRCRTCERESQKRLRNTSTYRTKHAAEERQRRQERKIQ